MYTQCPECQVAFRVTAKVLQQAGGNVRCGSCGHAFNALQYLSEEMPDRAPADSADAAEDPVDDLAETSRRLLATLDELAGPEEIRIEDTGVEWRVLDKAAAEDERRDPDQAAPADERRYDDNTPLPDDLEDDAAYVPPAMPLRREEDRTASSDEFEERQGDLALSEPEDWADILDEVRDPDAGSLEVEEELAAIHSELSAIDEALTDEVPHLDESELAEVADDAADEIEADLIDQIEAGAAVVLSTAADDDDAADTAEDLDDDEDTGVFESMLATDDSDVAAAIDQDNGAAVLAFSRESTGEFDAQIDEAARALDDGETASADDADAGDIEEFDDIDADDSDVEEFDDIDADGEFAAHGLPDDDDEDEELDDLDDDEAEDTFADDSRDDEDAFDDEAEDEVGDDDSRDDEDTFADDVRDDEAADEEEIAAAGEKFDIAATMVGLENPEDLFDESSGEVETIIMEGDFIRHEVQKERIAAENAARSELDDPAKLLDTYALNRGKVRGGRRNYDPPSMAMLGAVAGLALLLLGQFIHNSRQSLATNGFFNSTIAPVYRLLGSPVTPDWDVNGWQFEATNGSVDEEETTLTIVSRIGNRSSQSLPYPLIHVSLTNRFEDVMGSAILEPGEYLSGDGDPSQPVEPGENFNAVITVDDPSADATGFKLYVCYRVEAGTVRCADHDFKY